MQRVSVPRIRSQDFAHLNDDLLVLVLVHAYIAVDWHESRIRNAGEISSEDFEVAGFIVVPVQHKRCASNFAK